MTRKEIKNITTSVLAKLRDNSKSSGAPLQQVLQLYAMERFLYRISKSRHAQSVILKGALLLKTIGIPSARPTVDAETPSRAAMSLMVTMLSLRGICSNDRMTSRRAPSVAE